MIKKLILSLVILAFGLTATMASDGALTGKVVAIDGNQVKIEAAGELPSWARKGGHLRAVNEAGKLVLRGAKITGSEGPVIILTTTKANELKVGETFTLGKGKASAGC